MSQKFEFVGLVKADSELRQLHGTIYRANKLDTQGEFVTDAELTKMAHAALANGVKIDVNHDGQALAKKHASLVESTVVDEGGSKVWKGVVQLSEAAWAQLVKTGKVAAFSMGGRAPRRAVQKDGTQAREIYDAVVDFVSLVPKGAIGEPVVAKSDEAPAWAKQLMKDMNETAQRIAELDAEINGVRSRQAGKSSTSQAIVKGVQTEHDARVELRKSDLRARIAALDRRLQALWEGVQLPVGVSRVAEEQALCKSIDECRIELEALGGSDSVDLTDDRRSAFAHRGGVSQTFSAVPGDSAFAPNAFKKSGEDDIDLNFLRI